MIDSIGAIMPDARDKFRIFLHPQGVERISVSVTSNDTILTVLKRVNMSHMKMFIKNIYLKRTRTLAEYGIKPDMICRCYRMPAAEEQAQSKLNRGRIKTSRCYEHLQAVAEPTQLDARNRAGADSTKESRMTSTKRAAAGGAHAVATCIGRSFCGERMVQRHGAWKSMITRNALWSHKRVFRVRFEAHPSPASHIVLRSTMYCARQG